MRGSVGDCLTSVNHASIAINQTVLRGSGASWLEIMQMALTVLAPPLRFYLSYRIEIPQ